MSVESLSRGESGECLTRECLTRECLTRECLAGALGVRKREKKAEVVKGG